MTHTIEESQLAGSFKTLLAADTKDSKTLNAVSVSMTRGIAGACILKLHERVKQKPFGLYVERSGSTTVAEPEELTATELMQEFWKSPDELALAVEIRRRLERLEKCEAALRLTFSACGMHRLGLWKYECSNEWCKAARAALEESE